MKRLSSWVDRLLVVGFAILFSQVPLFMLQYQHQLMGHVAELEYQIEQLQQAAQQSGKILEQFIHKFATHSDPDFARQGQIMEAMVQRLHKLTQALLALEDSNAFTHPWEFLRYFDVDIAKSTFSGFTGGIPFSLEGLIYIILGMACGHLLFLGINQLCKRIASLFSKHPPTPPAEVK